MNTLKSVRKKNVILLASEKCGEFCCLTNEKYNTAAMNHLNGDTYKQVHDIKVETVKKQTNSSLYQVCISAKISNEIKR